MKDNYNINQLRLSLITNSRDFQRIKAEWNALLEESEANNIFLTWEWLYTWWEVYGQDFQLHIVTVRNPLGVLVGIAPFKVRNRGIPGIYRENVLEFIGWGGDVTSEYLDIIARKGWETKVFYCIARYIFKNNTWMKVDLCRLSSISPSIPILKRYMEGRGAPCRIEISSRCPVIVLPGSWEEFLSRKSVNFRKKGKEYRRISIRDLGVRLICCDSRETLKEGMEALTKLHLKRWGHGSTAFKTEKYVTFHQRVSRLFLENGWLRSFFLKRDDTMLAGIYCFYHNYKYYYYQSGRDPEYSKYRLGMVLLNEMIKEAIREKAVEFDLLTGDEAYKYRWAQYTKETVRLSCGDDAYEKAVNFIFDTRSFVKWPENDAERDMRINEAGNNAETDGRNR